MTKSNGHCAPSRRSIIKGAGALVAGVAAPSILSLRSAYAAYPDRPVKIIVANTPGGPSDIVGRITAERFSNQQARLSSSRISVARVEISDSATPRTLLPMATPFFSRPMRGR